MYCQAQHVQPGDVHPVYGRVTEVRPIAGTDGVRIQYGAFLKGYWHPNNQVLRVTRHLTDTALLHRKAIQ